MTSVDLTTYVKVIKSLHGLHVEGPPCTSLKKEICEIGEAVYKLF